MRAFRHLWGSEFENFVSEINLSSAVISPRYFFGYFRVVTIRFLSGCETVGTIGAAIFIVLIVLIIIFLQPLGFQMSKTAKQNKGDCGHWMSALDGHGEYCCVCCGCSRDNPCFVSALWGETTWNQVLAKPYAARKAKRGAKEARGRAKSYAGKNTKTATSRANSGDVGGVWQLEGVHDGYCFYSFRPVSLGYRRREGFAGGSLLQQKA